MPSPENSHLFGKEPGGKEQLPTPEIPRGAAAVAIINPENKVLLMKRVDYGAGHGDDWVYPGGAVDLGETLDQTARREVLEEAGVTLDPEKNRLFPLANYITAPDAFGVRHDLLVYVTRYHADQPQPRIASPDEMTDFGWFYPQEAIDRAGREELKVLPSGIFALQRIKEYLSDEHIRQYAEVLLGGTFDRLHEGHVELLERAFEVGDYVYIGVTTDEYIARSSKQHKEKVHPYQERLKVLRSYLGTQFGLNRAITLPLDDVAGPKALDPKLGALVVSEETALTGGTYVNNLRTRYGTPPMDTIVIPLKRDETGNIISSTRLRQAEEGEQRSPPEKQFKHKQILQEVKTQSPENIITTANEISELIKTKDLKPQRLVTSVFQDLQKEDVLDKKANILALLLLLEGKSQLHEGAEQFLLEISRAHNYTNEFSIPFKRFISERLRISDLPKTHKMIENPEESKRMLELIQTNSDFFYDILELQDYFTTQVSPIMPLNSTWNPLLTKQFKVKGAEGLWYVYANNKRSEYVNLMKQQATSEWTGFNRFSSEPWERFKGIVKSQGNLVDVGSSIGISAVETARALQMQGSIILLDYLNPFRHGGSLRIIDYANPNRRLIPLNEALEKVDTLRENRVLITLFGIDFGLPLSHNIKNLINNSSFVHCANIIPYLPQAKIPQAIRNALEATRPDGGILKFHNDESLPIDSVITSITLKRQENKLEILPDLVKSKY